MADYEVEDEVQIQTELEDSDFIKEHGDLVACIVQKLLCNQKIPDTIQHQIFYSRCLVKDKVCILIINNRSCENIMSRVLVDHLKLDIKPHHNPYVIGLIKKGHSIKVTDQCHVPISIIKFYQDSVACDVVDIDKCHGLLGRLWQHDIDVTHKGKENIYIFTWKGKKIDIRPITPTPKSTKKRPSKLVSICDRDESRFWDQTFSLTEFARDGSAHSFIDWNSKTSSFQKGGTDVRRQRTKSRYNQGPDTGLSPLLDRSRNLAEEVG